MLYITGFFDSNLKQYDIDGLICNKGNYEKARATGVLNNIWLDISYLKICLFDNIGLTTKLVNFRTLVSLFNCKFISKYNMYLSNDNYIIQLSNENIDFSSNIRLIRKVKYDTFNLNLLSKLGIYDRLANEIVVNNTVVQSDGNYWGIDNIKSTSELKLDGISVLYDTFDTYGLVLNTDSDTLIKVNLKDIILDTSIKGIQLVNNIVFVDSLFSKSTYEVDSEFYNKLLRIKITGSSLY